MSKRDYYEILGVDKGVSDKDLKKAYRRVAMKYHPDRNPDNKKAEDNFKEANEAYEILSDEQKRATYDQYGHAAFEGNSAGGGFNGGNFEDFGDIFSDIFGGGRQRRRGPSPGNDLQYNMTLDLEEAVKGTEKKIEIPTTTNCKICDGSGSKPGTNSQICSTCNGQGQIRVQQGFFAVQQTCPHCNGKGKTIKSPCNNCHGQGIVRERKSLNVKVPAGVDTGDRIRLSNEGEVSQNGGKNGDLFVEVSIRPHSIFKREGKHLSTEVPISFNDAALGGELEIPTLNGRIKLKIPEGTQSGKMFRLRGKGIKPIRGGNVGDMLCQVVVETPIYLTKHQKELLKQLQESLEGHDKHSPKKKGWFEIIKNFFDDMTK